MKLTRQCGGCKQDFRKTELIEYFSPSGKTSTWYCPKCLEEKQARERFSEKICQIFGLKNPGPRIWTERKRLINNYGYTDDVIIDCLDYIYNIQNKKKLVDSLCLVTPATVEQMKQYKRAQAIKSNQIAQAINTETREYIVPIKEKREKEKKNNWNPDDWLEGD